MDDLMEGANIISLFCRININSKRDLPIRSSEMGLLIFLVKEQGEHTPLTISRFFNVTKPMVSAMIHALTKKEYVIKIPSKTDKRSFVLKPTEKAIDLVNKTYEEYHKNMQLLMDGLGSDDFENLVNLLDRANSILIEEKDNG